jgi:hypothetical protein
MLPFAMIRPDVRDVMRKLNHDQDMDAGRPLMVLFGVGYVAMEIMRNRTMTEDQARTKWCPMARVIAATGIQALS